MFRINLLSRRFVVREIKAFGREAKGRADFFFLRCGESRMWQRYINSIEPCQWLDFLQMQGANMGLMTRDLCLIFMTNEKPGSLTDLTLQRIGLSN